MSGHAVDRAGRQERATQKRQERGGEAARACVEGSERVPRWSRAVLCQRRRRRHRRVSVAYRRRARRRAAQMSASARSPPHATGARTHLPVLSSNRSVNMALNPEVAIAARGGGATQSPMSTLRMRAMFGSGRPVHVPRPWSLVHVPWSMSPVRGPCPLSLVPVLGSFNPSTTH